MASSPPPSAQTPTLEIDPGFMTEAVVTTRRALKNARRPRWQDRATVTRAVDIVISLTLGATVVFGVVLIDPLTVGGVLLVCGVSYVFRALIVRRTSMLVVLAAVIMFVPIRRYALPIDVGFALEPYRVIIVALLVAVGAGLMAGRLVWKPIVWGWPIAVFLWLMYASLMFNAVQATATGTIRGGLSNIIQLTFLLSVVILVRQLLTTDRQVTTFLALLVLAGTAVGFLAFLERYTHVNMFLQLQRFLPLELLRDHAQSLRAGGSRSYASSQHPIALSVLFCMLVPIAIYLMKFGRWPRHAVNRTLVYIVAVGTMMVGMLTAVSRTGVVVLGAMFLFTLALRPKLAGRLFLIGLPFAALAAAVFPKLFSSTVLSLLNLERLMASQSQSVGMRGQGRLADIGPAMEQFAEQPWFGTGLGSRVVVGESANAQILDNQWLGTLLETGIFGIIGVIALLVYPVIRLVRFAFTSAAPPNRVFLAFAIASSALGYAVAAYFYDAFAFMQALLLLCMLLAVGAWAMTHGAEDWPKQKVPERPQSAART